MTHSTHLLITGAGGFVGQAVCAAAEMHGYHVRRALRTSSSVSAGQNSIVVGDMSLDTDWRAALQGIDVVIHLAARVHVMHEINANPLLAFRSTNVQATLQLARQAAAADIKRFIFISSVKVNGEESKPGQPFTADDLPAPVDPYGISKMEAEQLLLEIATATGMEVVIIRPPLVYGPGVKGNFFSMITWLSRGVPLPLGAIGNRRSLVALDNLVDLILLCCQHPAAVNQIFLVSDDDDLSTTALLLQMGKALGCPVRLIPVPESWLRVGAKVINKSAMASRLCGWLQVDISKTKSVLGWAPPVTADEGLRRIVRAGDLRK